MIWLATTPGGFYWPMFPIFGWAIGIMFRALDTYSPAMPAKEKIEREMHPNSGSERTERVQSLMTERSGQLGHL